jgi:hypothetical protein
MTELRASKRVQGFQFSKIRENDRKSKKMKREGIDYYRIFTRST